MSEETTTTINKYDRQRGNLHDVALFTRPSTIKSVQNITGESETYIVETCRAEDLGDFIFVECVDKSGTTRLCLPPKVADAIASQRDSLTKRRRSAASKKVMKERMARGEVLGFMKSKRGKHAKSKS